MLLWYLITYGNTIVAFKQEIVIHIFGQSIYIHDYITYSIDDLFSLVFYNVILRVPWSVKKGVSLDTHETGFKDDDGNVDYFLGKLVCKYISSNIKQISWFVFEYLWIKLEWNSKLQI